MATLCPQMIKVNYGTLSADNKIMSRHTKKGPYGFPVCGSSRAHAQSPIDPTNIRSCLKLLQGPY